MEEATAVALLAAARAGPDRVAPLDQLLSALSSSTLRDVEPGAALYAELFALLAAAWDRRNGFDTEALSRLHTLLAGMLALPEFRGEGVEVAAAPHLTPVLLDLALERAAAPVDEEAEALSGGATAQVSRGVAGAADLPGGKGGGGGGPPSEAQARELAAVRALLYWAYRELPSLRPALRVRLGPALLGLVSAPVPPPGLRKLLELLAAIIGGFGGGKVGGSAHRELLRDVLVPLHKPSTRLDETTPVLSLYHEPLTHCLLLLVQRQPAQLPAALSGLLALWPQPREGNSAKEVCRLPVPLPLRLLLRLRLLLLLLLLTCCCRLSPCAAHPDLVLPSPTVRPPLLARTAGVAAA